MKTNLFWRTKHFEFSIVFSKNFPSRAAGAAPMNLVSFNLGQSHNCENYVEPSQAISLVLLRSLLGVTHKWLEVGAQIVQVAALQLVFHHRKR